MASRGTKRSRTEKQPIIFIGADSTAFFKKFFILLKELVSEVNLEVTPKGISMQVLDSSHVALIVTLMQNDGFDEFMCSRPTVLGIQLGEIIKIFKAARTTDAFNLIVYEDANTLHVKCYNNKLGREMNCELQLIDLESQKMGIPKTAYDIVVKMSGRLLYETFSSLKTLEAEIVTIEATPAGISFSVKGSMTTMNFFYGICPETKDSSSSSTDESDEYVSVVAKEGVKTSSVRFALKYLATFSSTYNLTDKVTLSFLPGAPLSVEYEIPIIGSIRYYLAPKIDENDEEGEEK